MQIQDCPWEIENIGKRTVQLNYTKDDIYNQEEVCKAVKGYQYLVAKVPADNISCLLGLQGDGFKMIETQITYSKRIKDFDFNDRLLRMFKGKVSFKQAKNTEQLISILERMTPNMFSTDRIHLDPTFGPEVGLHRYRNWMTNEFKRGTILYEFIFEGKPVGFSTSKINGTINHVPLGGIYQEYQNMGLGIIAASSTVLFPTEMGYKDVKSCRFAVSSNNMPMIRCYNYFNYRVDELEYVLVKHKE